MITPALRTRVKERDPLAGQGIIYLNAIALEVIAPRTGKPEIFPYSAATNRLWNEMIYIERHAEKCLW
jgi:hypothetical protein